MDEKQALEQEVKEIRELTEPEMEKVIGGSIESSNIVGYLET